MFERRRPSREKLQSFIDKLHLNSGNVNSTALQFNIGHSTGTRWKRYAKEEGIRASSDVKLSADATKDQEISILRERVRLLETEVTQNRRDELTREEIRKHILKLADTKPEPPKWLTKIEKGETVGVPTLFASDWHWGEVVRPTEVGGVNEYDLEIAHKRAKKLITTTIDLLFNHISNPSYPGIVLALGGDMVSGTIHDELVATNEKPIMPVVVDLYGVLIGCVESLLEKFEYVYIPGVCGNHGRLTHKPIAKDRAATNFDWLLYQLLAKHFEKNKRVSFNIPDGPDAQWRVYSHEYMMTHGDQFKGGGGIAGPLMTIERGRHKKSTREVSIGGGFKTMLVAHWHTLIQLPHLVVNSSLKGLDEYAYQLNVPFERPAQALWITNPKNGITFQMPVYVDEPSSAVGDASWVSVFGD